MAVYKNIFDDVSPTKIPLDRTSLSRGDRESPSDCGDHRRCGRQDLVSMIKTLYLKLKKTVSIIMILFTVALPVDRKRGCQVEARLERIVGRIWI